MPECDILQLKNVSKSFQGTQALSDLSIRIPQGQITALIGPNGAGKTTVFNLCCGYLRPERGEILFNGDSIRGLAPYQIARRGLARTFQDLRLVLQMSALENVLLASTRQIGESVIGGIVNPRWRKQEAMLTELAIHNLEIVGLFSEAGQNTESLSYGQQKRLSIACCLQTGAELLLLDEPVAGVDPTTIEDLLVHLSGLPNQGKTVLLIEHNMDAIRSLSQHVIVLQNGRLIAEGPPDEVLDRISVLEAYLS